MHALNEKCMCTSRRGLWLPRAHTNALEEGDKLPPNAMSSKYFSCLPDTGFDGEIFWQLAMHHSKQRVSLPLGTNYKSNQKHATQNEITTLPCAHRRSLQMNLWSGYWPRCLASCGHAHRCNRDSTKRIPKLSGTRPARTHTRLSRKTHKQTKRRVFSCPASFPSAP